MKNFIKIGKILENGEIVKGATNQGLVFKDEEAFVNKKGICYIPELNDTEYTYKDFIDMTNDETLAKALFDNIDWQSPGTLLNDWIQDEEACICSNCNKGYLSYNIDNCPHCNASK